VPPGSSFRWFLGDYLATCVTDPRTGPHPVVHHVGRDEPRREGNPHTTHGDGQVQLPPINPPVPAALGPAGLGVYGSVGHHAGFLVLLVPHPTAGAKQGGVHT
jgi:hypothetical protein